MVSQVGVIQEREEAAVITSKHEKLPSSTMLPILEDTVTNYRPLNIFTPCSHLNARENNTTFMKGLQVDSPAAFDDFYK